MKPRKAPGARAAPTAPYYDQLAARIGGNRACLAIARKLLKRSYHVLRGLGDQALEPVAPDPVSRGKPNHQPMNRGQLPKPAADPARGGRPRKNERPHHHLPEHPTHIMSPTRNQPGSRAKVSLGVRGHTVTLHRALPRTPTRPDTDTNLPQRLDNPRRDK